MHAIQVRPILALLLAATALTSARKRRIMWVASAGYVGLILAVLPQTFEGRAPTALTLLATGVVLASALLGIAISG